MGKKDIRFIFTIKYHVIRSASQHNVVRKSSRWTRSHAVEPSGHCPKQILSQLINCLVVRHPKGPNRHLSDIIQSLYKKLWESFRGNFINLQPESPYLIHQVGEEDHHGVDDSHVGAYCTVRAGGLRVVFVGDVADQERSSFHKSDKFSPYLPYEISS